MSNNRFINPYNFVPFDKEPDRTTSNDTERKNTGFFDVTIKLKTDLIIPDGKKLDFDWETPIPAKDNKKHGHYRFFRLNGKPAIPGSSLRGMVRSVFEAASNSCLPFLLDDSFTMRSPAKKKGREEQGSWKSIMGKYSPCTDIDELCPACRLFGTTEAAKESKNGNGSLPVKGLKGRVRFTDALPTQPIKEDDIQACTLQILAEPRPTAFEFYLNKPNVENATYWNCKHYIIDGKQKERQDSKLVPRGRKFYWHSRPKPAKVKKGNMNATMECLIGGSTDFQFQVYFDGITDTELKQLEWALTFGENDADGRYCHKLGHARPLGYGSVKLTIDRITLRKLRWEGNRLISSTETVENPPKDFKYCWKNQEIIKALLKMADYDFSKNADRIDYPHLKDASSDDPCDDSCIFQWFVKNRKTRPINTLPDPLAIDLSLPKLEKEQKQNHKSNSKRW